MTKRWGATPEEWAHFKRLAKIDLLPVVSNPHAEISPASRMKSKGKTPSIYNSKRLVAGFTDWTDWEATVPNITEWSKEPDYGLCIQARDLRGFDCDVPDRKLADRICAAWLEALDVEHLPVRMRADSAKRLLAFRLEGEWAKRSFVVREFEDETTGKTKRWIVEFLGNGQQFVAAGTHPDGERYDWEGGLPAKIPTISAEQFERAWAAVVEEFAIAGKDRRAERRDPTLPEDLDIDDPVAEHLIEAWDTFGIHKGMLYVDCPWKDGHSSDNGETETAWLLAGTGKYRNGHFRCMHASCAGHTDNDFFTAVGFQLVGADEFEDLTLDDGAVDAYAALAAGASPKAKELKAERKALTTGAKLPLPGFNRDNSGRIETSLENIARALRAPQACGVDVAYDEFQGDLMLAETPGAWRLITDADAVQLRVTLEALGFKDKIGKELMRDALELVSAEQRFDSAKAWLDTVVPAWDGVPRVASFFPRYFATEDTPYTRAVGEYAWTAQAGRIIDPGCKADMVPVLVGPQGVRKSSGIAAISPAEDFFSEFDLEAKDDDKARKMRGCLVGELAELRGLQTRDRESILAWIVRRFEQWTPKFKERAVRLARRCVFYGSTNDDEFLNDPTGERRWLPLEVRGLVDVDAITRDRLQLWAEAREAYLECGVLFARAERLARSEHHKFKVVDSWELRTVAWLDTPWALDSDETPRTSGRLLADDVLTDCIGLQASKITKRDQMRMTGILKKLGMVKAFRRVSTSKKQVDTGPLPPSKVWIDGGDDA